MVETVLGRLLFVQMTGQAISWVDLCGNDPGDGLCWNLAVTLVIDNFAICRMADGAIACPMQSENFSPVVKDYSPGIGAIVTVTGITGLVA